MKRLLSVAAALAAVLFSGLWLLTFVASGFTIPPWVPMAGLFSASVAVALLAL